MSIDRSMQVTALVLILALIGLAGIYFAASNLEPVDVNVESIEDSMTGKLVRITGRIDNIRKTSSNNIYWTVNDGSNITIPLLDSKFKKISATKGNTVEIVGLVSQYKGELEIMPKEITVLSE